MNSVASDWSTVACNKTNIGNQLTALPVKNTFIHFEDSDGGSIGNVKRFTTDPSSETRTMPCFSSRLHCSPLIKSSERTKSNASESGSDQPTRYASSSTASEVSTEDSCNIVDVPLAPIDDDLVQAPDCDGSGTSTPEVSPRWAGTSATNTPASFWMPVCSSEAWPSSAADCTMTLNSMAFPPVSPFTVLEDGVSLFAFMMRRSTCNTWGVKVKRDVITQALLVVAVLPGGAIDSWNKQVASSPKANAAVSVGDLFVNVNGKHDCFGMVEDMKSSLLLKMDVLRLNNEAIQMMLNETQADLGWEF